MGVAKDCGLDFVQEVFATYGAVSHYLDHVDSIVELGGEDAKIIFCSNGLEERMNGSCAGGTGAFIDQMATLLNLSLEEFDKISMQHEKILPLLQDVVFCKIRCSAPFKSRCEKRLSCKYFFKQWLIKQL